MKHKINTPDRYIEKFIDDNWDKLVQQWNNIRQFKKGLIRVHWELFSGTVEFNMFLLKKAHISYEERADYLMDERR